MSWRGSPAASPPRHSIALRWSADRTGRAGRRLPALLSIVSMTVSLACLRGIIHLPMIPEG